MSGIAGVWHLDGRPVDAGVLEEIGSRIAHRGPDGVRSATGDSWGLVSALSRVAPESAREIQPVRHSSGAVVVFDGRLDNREDLLALLGGAVAKDAPDSELVAAAFARLGDRVPDRLKGDFAFAVVDPGRERVLLCRDVMGMRPLFYFRSRELIVFGSEIKAILAHPQVAVRPDEEELAGYVLAGSPQGRGERTFFRGIERVLPSHCMLFERERTASRMYWDFDHWQQLRLPSFGDYAERFRHHFEQAVVRRLRSAHPVAISLSGGLDSSSIFCLSETLRRDGRRGIPGLIALTYSSFDGSLSDEQEFLADIKTQYGVDVLEVPPKPSPPTDTVRESVWTTESPTAETLWEGVSAFHARAAGAGARVLLTGHLGDQLVFDRSYLVDLFDRFHWAKVVAHLKEYSRWYLEADTSPLRREFFRQLIRDHLPASWLPVARRVRAARRPPAMDSPWYTERFRKLASRPVTAIPLVRWQFASAHAHSIYQQARSRQTSLAIEWDNRAVAAHGLDLSFPYADRDLLVFLMSIPGEMTSYGGVPRAILREAMRDVIPESVRNRRWKATFGRMMEEALEAGKTQLIAAIVGGGAAARLGFVDREKVRRRIATLGDDIDDEALWDLATLLGLEVWADTFFSDRAARPLDAPTPSGII